MKKINRKVKPIEARRSKKYIYFNKIIQILFRAILVIIAIAIFYTIYVKCLTPLRCGDGAVIILGILGFILLETAGFPCSKIVKLFLKG